MGWSLAAVALAVLVVAPVSQRLTGGPITPAMVFVALGLLAGPSVLGEVDVSPSGAAVRTLADRTTPEPSPHSDDVLRATAF